MVKIKDIPKFQRPREKLFAQGTNVLGDYELLAILLRTGYQGKSAVEIAKRILRTKKLKDLAHLTPQALAKIKGVGRSRAAIIVAAIALAKRVLADNEQVAIRTPLDVVKLVNSLTAKKQEHLVALYLNARNIIAKQQTISIGTLMTNLIHPREVFAPALQNHAARIIVIHNHPSGNPQPSAEDVKITRRLMEAGKILGIRMLDHIIVAQDGYFSFYGKDYFSS